MKKIGIITALSPAQQYEIYRWFWSTVFLLVCLVGVASYYIVPHIITYRQLQKDITQLRYTAKEYSTLVSTKQGLKKEYDELHAQEIKINSYTLQKKNPYFHIAEIIHSCGDKLQLQSVKFNKKEIEIEIVSPAAKDAHVFSKNLSALPSFSQVKMVSLQPDTQNKQVRCTIKGNVIF